ncbi:hypothetical protein [Photobacterium leiognathi]|uniref:hypothetical protein n=1 Tax=Photobacterium leiognathi TaxID=553611 RepID=UPI002980CB1E|nr:hypothetical protein [Photobacterium leiognathi]
MEITQLKVGMWVESFHGVGEVIGIDQQNNAVIIEHKDDHQLRSVECNELVDQPQLHTGCDRYY